MVGAYSQIERRVAGQCGSARSCAHGTTKQQREMDEYQCNTVHTRGCEVLSYLGEGYVPLPWLCRNEPERAAELSRNYSFSSGGCASHSVIRASRASRRPSPTKLILSTVRTIITPG